MHKENLIEILQGIDEEAALLLGVSSNKARVILVGGAAFMLRDLTTRQATHDIDVLSADAVVRGIIASYPEVNGGVAAFADQIPYNFEDRLVRLNLSTQAIDFFAPSTEDLVVMKLYAQRPNDVQDIDGAIASGQMDWELLETLVYGDDEAKASCLVERHYEEMVRAYETIKARWER